MNYQSTIVPNWGGIESLCSAGHSLPLASLWHCLSYVLPPTTHQPPLSMQIRLPMFFQIAISIIRPDPLSSTATSVQTHPKQYLLCGRVGFIKPSQTYCLSRIIWLALVNQFVKKFLILFLSPMMTGFTPTGYITSSKIMFVVFSIIFISLYCRINYKIDRNLKYCTSDCGRL